MYPKREAQTEARIKQEPKATLLILIQDRQNFRDNREILLMLYRNLDGCLRLL